MRNLQKNICTFFFSAGRRPPYFIFSNLNNSGTTKNFKKLMTVFFFYIFWASFFLEVYPKIRALSSRKLALFGAKSEKYRFFWPRVRTVISMKSKFWIWIDFEMTYKFVLTKESRKWSLGIVLRAQSTPILTPFFLFFVITFF